MKAMGSFLKKHWLTLVLLIGTLLAVNWLVSHKRAPGSMTVIEAQGMDMTTMKPPGGSMPVSVETVRYRALLGGDSFPATVSALDEVDVVARVPGRLSRLLVYPGDKVSAGQLLGTIDAPEYEAQLRKALAMSGAKSAEVVSAERMIAHHRNVLVAANASIRGAQVAKDRATTDLEAAALELAKSKDELPGMRAAKDERQADLIYAENEWIRQRTLFAKGAISLDELQASQRDRDAAAARVRSAEAAVQSATQSVRIAEKRQTGAKQMVEEAESKIASAKAEAEQAKEGIAQARADGRAIEFESNAASAEASGARTVADYRRLTALANGVVAERLVSQGTAVTAGQVILRLKSVGTVRVQADVPQGQSDAFHLGTSVRVTGEGFDLPATITSVFPTVDPQTRTFRVEARVANVNGVLKPGMFARIELQGSGDRALTIRSAALQSGEVGKFVWSVLQTKSTSKSDWTCTMHPEVSKPGPGKCPLCGMDLTLRQKGGALVAHRQPVMAGRIVGDYTEVITGLKEGDQVIWAGYENLTEGMSVHEAGTAVSGEASMSGMSPSGEGKEPKPNEQFPIKAYYCPMHPEVQSDRPAKCPKCSMGLVKRGAK